MTCPVCKPWCATSEKQFENRLANMADAPDVSLHPCPQCDGIDWAITRDFIERDDRPAWRRIADKLLGSKW